MVLGTATAAGAGVDQPAAASGSSRASLPAAGARPDSFASLHGVITRITAGRSARFTYTVMNLASGQTAQLQRTFGTAKSWREVAHLAAKRNAPLTAPALGPLGKYAYRVAIARASTPAGAIGSVTVALDSGPVYIDTATGDGAPIFFNMTGS